MYWLLVCTAGVFGVRVIMGQLIALIPMFICLFLIGSVHEFFTGDVAARQARDKVIGTALDAEKAKVTTGPTQVAFNPITKYLGEVQAEVRNDSALVLDSGQFVCRWQVGDYQKRNGEWDTRSEHLRSPESNIRIQPGEHRLVRVGVHPARLRSDEVLVGPVACEYQPTVNARDFEATFPYKPGQS